jgi:hypothetical protein
MGDDLAALFITAGGRCSRRRAPPHCGVGRAPWTNWFRVEREVRRFFNDLPPLSSPSPTES